MQLESIQIKNYRSIEDITFDINVLDDGSYTFGLIGVNEAGKSSILKAMSLKDSLVALSPKDFNDKTKKIEVLYKYRLSEIDVTEDFSALLEDDTPPTILTAHPFAPNDLVGFKISFLIATPSVPVYEFLYSNKKADLANVIGVTKSFFEKMHQTVFWTAKGEYLISEAVNLTAFAANPAISIPLKNCFLLAEIDDIQARVSSISGDSTEKEELEEQLGKAVTEHILAVWPGHPIKITFDIDGELINFHVKDTNVKGKAKTAGQRSDGFKQFISFLLTVSAEDRNDELENCLLLLDEPETHLHPKAQEDFLSELKKITTNKRGNVVIFATHSNYMIDKAKLSRNFKVIKENVSTFIEEINTKNSTFASVNYEVFGIVSSDYHNELYGFLHQKFQDEDQTDDKREKVLVFDTQFLHERNKLPKDKPWKGNLKQATLSTYIRNCIHHPDNGDTYTQSELKSSIESMKRLAK
ncbi:ATP-dependent nuclease [Methylotenera sp. L2L1]|uniref:ATP-dependent nuclease n=1 Tax=Methylotenera sp. L2L1 TaxID=1502770 RepID=UPI0005643280|nr:ATP-binding protein [Methylotenera sp. L2L1]